MVKGKKQELSLVIPFYNEEKNVEAVLTDLSSFLNKAKIDYEIVAVDNGSLDSTSMLIDSFSKKNKRVRKLKILKNKGYGYGILQGLKSCTGKYVGYLWGDNQIPNNSIPKLLNGLKNGRDLCKITRKSRTESFSRKIQSFVYNSMMFLFFGVKSKDVNGCPKIMKKEVFQALRINSYDWFIDAEIMIKCKRKRFKVLEIPVISSDRDSGKSNVNYGTAFEFLKNIMKYSLGGKK